MAPILLSILAQLDVSRPDLSDFVNVYPHFTNILQKNNATLMTATGF